MTERVICPHCKHVYGSEDDKALNSTYSKGNFICIFGCGKDFPAPQGNILKAMEGKQSSSRKLKSKYSLVRNIAIVAVIIFISMVTFFHVEVKAIGLGYGDLAILILIVGVFCYKVYKGYTEESSEPANANTESQPRLISCTDCGKQVSIRATMCPHCGSPVDIKTVGAEHQGNARAIKESRRRILPVFLLWLFLGSIGFHRFYVKKFGTGILIAFLFIVSLHTFIEISVKEATPKEAPFLFVTVIWAVWLIVDLVMIVTGSFKDSEGLAISKWT